MPTFTFEPLTATSYRVRDAHTGEAYGIVSGTDAFWTFPSAGWAYRTRTDAATALYQARYAHGFEAGAL